MGTTISKGTGKQTQKNRQWENAWQDQVSDQTQTNYGQDTVTENQTSRAYKDYSGLSPEDIALGKRLYDYQYKPSAEAQAAKSQMGASADKIRNYADYTGTHAANLKDTLNQLMNRGPFNYDFNNDAMYNMYKEMYAKQGKDAATNAAAASAALSGGYGNTYGTTAAAQANQQYMTELNNMLPQLQQMARENYDSETDRLNNLYNILFNANEAEYAKYSDKYNRAMDLANFDANQYYNLSNEEQNLFNNDYARANDLYRLALDTKGVNVNETNGSRETKYDSGTRTYSENSVESGSESGSSTTTKSNEKSTSTSSGSGGSGGGKKGGSGSGTDTTANYKLTASDKNYMDIAKSKMSSTSDAPAYQYLSVRLNNGEISDAAFNKIIKKLGIRDIEELQDGTLSYGNKKKDDKKKNKKK